MNRGVNYVNNLNNLITVTINVNIFVAASTQERLFKGTYNKSYNLQMTCGFIKTLLLLMVLPIRSVRRAKSVFNPCSHGN